MTFSIVDADFHEHLKERMEQRGISKEELEQTINTGWEAGDAKPGTMGKVMVFPYQKKWEGRLYEEKEVSVYYKIKGETLVLLTVKARYGRGFSRGSTL
jgi:hypothetical protein